MATRKYISELAMNALIQRILLAQQGDLTSPEIGEWFDAEHPCHIYMICRRPRVTIDLGSVSVTKESIAFNLALNYGQRVETVLFTAPNDFGPDMAVKSEYPFTTFEFVRPGIGVVFSGKVAHLLLYAKGASQQQRDLEVLYIGQSYGDQGSRTAPDRLQSHSTLQGIYAESLARSPEMDIWIVLCWVEPVLFVSMDPRQPTQTTPDEDMSHLLETVRHPPSEQEQINFAEAGLIRYFQPPFNEMFKNSFPSPAHKTYSGCYDADLNALMIEVQTEDARFRLWSAAAAPKWTHIQKYDLHDRIQRCGMFEGMLPDQGSPATP
ncbi:MAG: hypothetical protein U0640_07870 [Phycisphaerales bacterium]